MRRVFLWLGLLALLLFSCSKKKAEVAPVRFVAVLHQWTKAIEPKLVEFTQETGIPVTFESYTEEQLSNKTTVELNAGFSTLDVMMFRPLQDGLIFAANNWLEELDSYVSRYPDYDFADFSAGAVGTVTIKDKLLAIPLITETQLLYYNKDLFRAAGLTPPTTLVEMEERAAALSKEGQYGVVYRGKRSAAVTPLSSFLQSNGTFYQDANWQANLLDPVLLETVKFYGDMLRKYGPPGVLNMSWPQAAEIFSQGLVAMYTEASSLFSAVANPQKINFEVGVAPFPQGSKGRHAYNIAAWGLVISRSSQNKEAAWELIRWLSGKKMMHYAAGQGNSMARKSAWSDEVAGRAFPQDFIESVRINSEGAVPLALPRLIRVQEARDVIGNIIVAAIEGQPLEPVAQEAQLQFSALLAEE